MTTYSTQTPKGGNETNQLLAVFVLIIVAVILIVSGCKSPEKIMDKAYKTVSTDPAPATEKRKAQLAGWVAANFPIREKEIEKIVVERVVDTSEYDFFRKYIALLNEQLSISNCPTIDADSIMEVAKKTFKADTVKTTKIKEIIKLDTTGNWLKEQKQIELISIIGSLNGDKEVLQNKIKEKTEESNKKDKWLWYFIASLVVLVLSHILRSKLNFKIPKIPFIG
jgi:hypothetical protein